MLMSHGSISRHEAVEWMELYLGSDPGDALTGDLGYLQLSGRMNRIRDHIYVVMRSGLVPKGTEE
jgi:hypothetical protein